MWCTVLYPPSEKSREGHEKGLRKVFGVPQKDRARKVPRKDEKIQKRNFLL
jgi:hypothetical protein